VTPPRRRLVKTQGLVPSALVVAAQDASSPGVASSSSVQRIVPSAVASRQVEYFSSTTYAPASVGVYFTYTATVLLNTCISGIVDALCF
jgi:hypothetical protein